LKIGGAVFMDRLQKFIFQELLRDGIRSIVYSVLAMRIVRFAVLSLNELVRRTFL